MRGDGQDAPGLVSLVDLGTSEVSFSEGGGRQRVPERLGKKNAGTANK
jgi:hypothetical protein